MAVKTAAVGVQQIFSAVRFVLFSVTRYLLMAIPFVSFQKKYTAFNQFEHEGTVGAEMDWHSDRFFGSYPSARHVLAQIFSPNL